MFDHATTASKEDKETWMREFNDSRKLYIENRNTLRTGEEISPLHINQSSFIVV